MDENITPKKKNILFRLITFLITLALVAGAIFLVANRDKINLDSLKRYITYRSLARNDSGQTESFAYSGASGDVFAVVDDDLLVCSTGGIRLYSAGGVCYVEDAVILSAPVAEVCGRRAAVYSAGGNAIYLYRDRTRYGSLTDLEGELLSVRLNDEGWLAVTTRESGYKAVVTVYDDELVKRMSFRLSSAFVNDAVVTADCKSLAVITLAQNGVSFQSDLSVYSLSTGMTSGVDYDLTAEETVSLGNNVILNVRGGEVIRCVGDTGISAWSGGEIVTWSYPEECLKSIAFGEDFTAALVGKYQAGSQAELIAVDTQGVESQHISVNEQVLSMSAAGRYAAVLTADRLDIYTQDMTLYSTLNGTNGAKKAMVRSDGTVFLIGEGTARLYVPD